MKNKMDFNGATAIVIGGLGFIGSNLSRKLLEHNAKVVIIDAMLKESGSNLYNINDISDKVKLIKGYAQDKIRDVIGDAGYVFNVAGQTSHPLSMQQPLLDFKLNVETDLCLLEACRLLNPSAKIVHASTRQIYGSQTILPIKEEASLNPPDVNAVNKIAAENYYSLYNKVYGIKAVSLRLTNTFGPGQTMKLPIHGFIPRLIRELISNGEIKLPPDCDIKRDINFIDDVSMAFIACALSNIDKGAYNLGNNEIISIKDFANRLLKANGSGKCIESTEPIKSGINIGSTYLDFGKFNSLTGWKPQVTLEEGITRTLKFYKQNKEKYQ
ncbi:MAG: NAD-dependent epimerase/dehydratase family protein [Nanoarchaeota archaeon]